MALLKMFLTVGSACGPNICKLLSELKSAWWAWLMLAKKVANFLKMLILDSCPVVHTFQEGLWIEPFSTQVNILVMTLLWHGWEGWKRGSQSLAACLWFLLPLFCQSEDNWRHTWGILICQGSFYFGRTPWGKVVVIEASHEDLQGQAWDAQQEWTNLRC